LLRSETVLWAGDNPYIRLFDKPDGGHLQTVGSFFRVQYSPAGTGHVLFVSTSLDTESPAVLCLSDNEALARFLFSAIAHRFTGFDGILAPDQLQVTRAEFTSDQSPTSLIERARSTDTVVELGWHDIGSPLYVELVHGKLPYRLFSLFIPAKAGTVTIDGVNMAGVAVADNLEGRLGTTACLALAETWVAEPDDGAQ